MEFKIQNGKIKDSLRGDRGLSTNLYSNNFGWRIYVVKTVSEEVVHLLGILPRIEQFFSSKLKIGFGFVADFGFGGGFGVVA